MKNILDFSNLYKYDINFNYQNKNSFYSVIAIILSLFVYGIMIIFSYYFSKDLILQENPKINFRETIMSGYYNISLIEMFESYTLNFDLIKHKEEENYFEELINEKYEKLEDLIIFQIKYIASYNSDSIENRIINLRNTEFNINNMDCAENIDYKCFRLKIVFSFLNYEKIYVINEKTNNRKKKESISKINFYDKNNMSDIYIPISYNNTSDIDINIIFKPEIYSNLLNSSKTSTNLIHTDHIINTNEKIF